MSMTRIRSSSPLELVTGTSTASTLGTGSQHTIAACLKSSMSCALSRLKPVISPSSSMPMTSLPPAKLANAMMCFAISSVSLRALFRSKYWFSFTVANTCGSLASMGCCIYPPFLMHLPILAAAHVVKKATYVKARAAFSHAAR